MSQVHSLIRILIGGALCALAGCSSNPVYAPDRTFEHEGFTFTRDSVSYSSDHVIKIGNDTDPVDQTWTLLQFLAGETGETDAEERIAALRREMRNGQIVRDYSWPMKDRSAKWIIEALQTYRINGDRQWLVTAYEAATAALDAQWDVNYIPATGLLRGETDITGLNEPDYPQWMRLPDKLCTMHLSTNAITIVALRAVAAMAEYLHTPSARFTQRADSLIRAINRYMWIPQTGTYARNLYSHPYDIPCNTVDPAVLLLTVTAGVPHPQVASYMFAQLSQHGTELLKATPKYPSIRWNNNFSAVVNEHDHTLLIYENGRCEQSLDASQTHIEIPSDNRFCVVNVVPESTYGTTGYSTRPHKYIPHGALIEIEAENVGISGTSLIRQKSMARRFIELTPTKNSHLSFKITASGSSPYLLELLYTDGTSYQPWQLRNVTVNGVSSGIIAMPKLYSGPSTRGTSTTMMIQLNDGVNTIGIDTSPLLPPRGSILLDKIRLIRLN